MTAEVTGGAKAKKYLALLGAIGAAVVAAVPAPASASVADSYEDKRVRIIGGGPPGGGVERYARAPGRHIFRRIPFRPPLPRSDA